jgi:hypothetical protein
MFSYTFLVSNDAVLAINLHAGDQNNLLPTASVNNITADSVNYVDVVGPESPPRPK